MRGSSQPALLPSERSLTSTARGQPDPFRGVNPTSPAENLSRDLRHALWAAASARGSVNVMKANRLYGREAECARLAKLADGVLRGDSAVLVVHGQPGTGKTALLDFVTGLDAGPRVVRV